MARLQQGVTPSVTTPYSVPSCCIGCGVNQYSLVGVWLYMYVHVSAIPIGWHYPKTLVPWRWFYFIQVRGWYVCMSVFILVRVCVFVCLCLCVCVFVCMCSCVDCMVRCIQSPSKNPEPQCHALVLYCHAVQSLNYEKPDNKVPSAEKKNISKWTSVSFRY